MYIVIWENRHPFSKNITQHWEEFDSKKAAEERLDGLRGVNHVKQGADQRWPNVKRTKLRNYLF